MACKWGIELGDYWPGYGDQDRLNRSTATPTNVPDEAVVSTTLLVDQHGRPLIVREPRRVGFDPKRSKP
jgi:hypothetical protein